MISLKEHAKLRTLSLKGATASSQEFSQVSLLCTQRGKTGMSIRRKHSTTIKDVIRASEPSSITHTELFICSIFRHFLKAETVKERQFEQAKTETV